MQDIREVASAIVDHARLDPTKKAGQPGHLRPLTAFSPAFPVYVHGMIRAYAVDLLLSISNTISPENESEVKVVNWLKGELVKIAQGIPPEQQPRLPKSTLNANTQEKR